MKKIRVGVNGMGRIGRTILREWASRNIETIEIVAVNNPGTPESYIHLLKYDSLHGVFDKDIVLEGQQFSIENKRIQFLSETSPANIAWSDYDVDVVIDSSGKFRDMKGLSQHLGGSVKKVIMCAPGKDLDGTFVMGINHQDYQNSVHHVVSNASCTTNCLAPVAKVLHDNFEIENGFMTTVHAYTLDQNILDSSHKDLRRARAAAVSMIPTSTGAAKALGQVIPSLKGKLDGYAVRVPTPDVSMIDLTVNLKKNVSVEMINKAMQEASEGSLKNILDYTEEELVSIDFTGHRASSIYDAKLTNVIGQTVKLVAWYDNEVGFSNRVIDLANFIGSKL